jgi:hypothetical protein
MPDLPGVRAVPSVGVASPPWAGVWGNTTEQERRAPGLRLAPA